MSRGPRLGGRLPVQAAMAATVVAATALTCGGAQAATAHGPTLQQQSTSYDEWAIGAAMAYDGDTGQVMLYGGHAFTDVCGCNGTGGTWVWNGVDFKQVAPAGASTFYSSLVFDAATHQMLRVGGAMADDATPVDTTSVWTGSGWQTLAPQHKPSPRLGDVSTYDAHSGQLILFGGGNSGGALGETWTWTGTDWFQLTPAVSPPPRQLQTMAYDDAPGQVVMYGGRGQAGYLGDTWTWNGTTWKQLTPRHSPGPLVSAAMAYDPALHAVVLFGGRIGTSLSTGATWKWTGSDWVQLTGATGPTDVNWPSMAYDPGAGQLLLMSPLGDRPNGVANEVYLVAAPTATSLTTTTTTGGSGLPVSLTSRITAKDVTAAVGTVAFTIDGHPVPGCSSVPVVGGSATCDAAVPPGAHTLRAAYSGGPGFLPSVSAKATLTIS
jgi:hypothetical protein